jgi:hypothetical protein
MRQSIIEKIVGLNDIARLSQDHGELVPTKVKAYLMVLEHLVILRLAHGILSRLKQIYLNGCCLFSLLIKVSSSCMSYISVLVIYLCPAMNYAAGKSPGGGIVLRMEGLVG